MTLDIFLPQETKNLWRINILGGKFNSYLDKSFLKEIKKDLLKIKTEEHKEKIDLYLTMINTILWK